MIFGPFEILICLGTIMAIALIAALALAAQNIVIWWKGLGPRCPKCLASINPEAYVCWSCKAELEKVHVDRKELP